LVSVLLVALTVETSTLDQQAPHAACSRSDERGLGAVLRLRGGRKGISAKHTAGEEAAKNKLATGNIGGGKAGIADRTGGAAGHAKFVCPICNSQAPSLKNMQMHHDSKHAKVPWDESIYINSHELHGGVTTAGVAVHGTLKTEKVKKRLKEEKDAAKKASK